MALAALLDFIDIEQESENLYYIYDSGRRSAKPPAFQDPRATFMFKGCQCLLYFWKWGVFDTSIDLNGKGILNRKFERCWHSEFQML